MLHRERYKDIDFESFINSPNVKAFIGKNYDYYKGIWTRDYEKKGRNILKISVAHHWNWLGFLAGLPVWYCYRKMYGMAAMLTALYCAPTVYEYYAEDPISPAAFLGVNLVLLLHSKGTYFVLVLDFFEKNKDLSQSELEEKIARKGSASTLAAIIGGLLVYGAIISTALVCQSIFGPLPEVE